MNSNDIIYELVMMVVIFVAPTVFSLMLIFKTEYMVRVNMDLLPGSERNRYDRMALCRFKGIALLVFEVTLLGLTICSVFGVYWLGKLLGYLIFAEILFTASYINTGERFRK